MPPNIVDLPPEVIEEIFDYLPKANDRRRLSQVCRTFYTIIRHQSKHFGTLCVGTGTQEKSPIHVFKNSSATLPFSKLHVEYCAHENIIQNEDFWQEYGQNITELTINTPYTIQCLTFFPCVKKLKLDQFSRLLNLENASKIQLPIEELYIEFSVPGFNIDEICYVLQCCPSLKSVVLPLGYDYLNHCVKLQLLPWIESIETVKVNVQEGIRLNEIVELPSKVVLQRLHISSDTNLESIASFFNKPRFIETLCLEFHSYNHFQYSHFNSWITMDQILSMLKAESIEKLILHDIPNHPESLNQLAQVPGLQEIEFSFERLMIFFPRYYWSNPNTVSKIHNIEFQYPFDSEALTGLDSLSSLTIEISDGNLEVVRNHPKLKKLVIRSLDDYGAAFSDADLDPISSLHDLEILELNQAPNITLFAFETFIKFPKLKKFVIYSREMKNDVAMLLPENCPNLEELELHHGVNIGLNWKEMYAEDIKDSLNDTGFEHLIRALPYLKKMRIAGDRHTVSREKVQQMQMEFPYLKIIVTDSIIKRLA